MRKNELEYLKPVFLHDVVEIKVYLKHIGEKSFTLAYEVIANNEIRTLGTSVLVCFDNSVKQSIKIPELMRKSLEKLELKLEQ